MIRLFFLSQETAYGYRLSPVGFEMYIRSRPCPVWSGVQCDPATKRVIGIDLSSVQLCSAPPCPLPGSLLQAVSALRVLRLPRTGVTLQLSQLGQVVLPLLRELDLSDNPGVVGPLPHGLPTALPKLAVLRLASTQNLVRALLTPQ